MTKVKTTINRRSFLKASVLAGGGMMLSFNWLAGYQPGTQGSADPVDKWFELNSYIRIGADGTVTLMAPNPEFGQNVKTSLPMIVAEELDIDWEHVIVEQADFFPQRFERQFTGGSQSVRQGWKILRTAGATARQMLVSAAAENWKVPVGEITTEAGTIYHRGSGRKAGYGEMASRAAGLPVPKEVQLKAVKDFRQLVREKSNWNGPATKAHRGVSAYFCHNSYVAEVLDLEMVNNQPVVQKVVAAVDCGIVINPDAATNMGEGGIIDGIGNALFGEMTFTGGVPAKKNFDTYRMIRQKEAPKAIEIHFVKNDQDPTGLGEPLFPPIFGAVANALYRATGKRFYDQPFGKALQEPAS